MNEQPDQDRSAEAAVDDAFRALANRRRRLTLAVLSEVETALTVTELAEAITAREHEDPSRRAVRDVEIDLHHAQIPHLTEAGLARYTTDSKRIEATPRAERFDELLATITAETERRDR